MPLVEIPGVGEVEFPYDMAPEDIAQQAKRLFEQAQAQGPVEERTPPRDETQPDVGSITGVEDYISPPAREVGAMAIRGLGPFAGTPLGPLGIAGAGAASEALAETIEGKPLDPLRIGIAGAPIPGAAIGGSRLLRGLGNAAAGAGRKMGVLPNLYGAGKSTALVEAESLFNAGSELYDRFGGMPEGRLGAALRHLARPTGTGPSTELPLKTVENVRRLSRGKTPEHKMLGGAARGVIEQSDQPAAQQLNRALTESGALGAVTRKPSLYEILAMLGLGGGGFMYGGPAGAAAAVTLPRAYQLLKRTPGAPGLEGALTGAGLGLSSYLGP